MSEDPKTPTSTDPTATPPEKTPPTEPKQEEKNELTVEELKEQNESLKAKQSAADKGKNSIQKEFDKLKKEREELAKFKEEAENKNLNEEEKRAKELDKREQESRDKDQKLKKAEIRLEVANLTASEDEHPEIKNFIDFIGGSTPEEAKENFEKFKAGLAKVKKSWEEGTSSSGSIPKVSSKRGRTEVNAFEQAKESGDIQGMLRNAPIIQNR